MTKLFITTTVLCALVLFGSLIATMATENVNYFVFGYPIAVVFLVVAYFVRRNQRINR